MGQNEMNKDFDVITRLCKARIAGAAVGTV